MKRLILFDIDGTLLLSGGAGKQAFNEVFWERYQIKEAWQDTRPDGRTDPSLITELVHRHLGRRPDSWESQEIGEHYIKTLAKTLPQAPRFRLMPGAKGLLAYLSAKENFVLGLATGNFEQTAYLKLEQAGLRHHFVCGGFGSDSQDRVKLTKMAVTRGMQALGRLVEPEEILLVGDSIHDVRAGRLLGLTTLAVCTGSTTREQLATYRPDFILDSLEDFSEVEPIVMGL